jgi:hypothetical protein
MNETKAIDELANSASGRLELCRRKSISTKLIGMSYASLIPFLTYSTALLSNNLAGGQYVNPLEAGMVSAISMTPAPIAIADGLKLFNGNGKNLSYNSGFDLVAKINDNISNNMHGFRPLLLGDKPYLLERNEAQIMPIETYYSTDGLVEATLDNTDMILAIPKGVRIKEKSEGIAAIKRSGKYSFAILAFASYDSFM